MADVLSLKEVVKEKEVNYLYHRICRQLGLSLGLHFHRERHERAVRS